MHILHPYPHDFYGQEVRVVMLGYVRPEYNYPSFGTSTRPYRPTERIGADERTVDRRTDKRYRDGQDRLPRLRPPTSVRQVRRRPILHCAECARPSAEGGGRREGGRREEGRRDSFVEFPFVLQPIHHINVVYRCIVAVCLSRRERTKLSEHSSLRGVDVSRLVSLSPSCM